MKIQRGKCSANASLNAASNVRSSSNPRQLRQEIYDLIDQIFALPGAVPGVTEDVFQTLMSHPSSEREEEEDDEGIALSLALLAMTS